MSGVPIRATVSIFIFPRATVIYRNPLTSADTIRRCSSWLPWGRLRRTTGAAARGPDTVYLCCKERITVGDRFTVVYVPVLEIGGQITVRERLAGQWPVLRYEDIFGIKCWRSTDSLTVPNQSIPILPYLENSLASPTRYRSVSPASLYSFNFARIVSCHLLFAHDMKMKRHDQNRKPTAITLSSWNLNYTSLIRI